MDTICNNKGKTAVLQTLLHSNSHYKPLNFSQTFRKRSLCHRSELEWLWWVTSLADSSKQWVKAFSRLVVNAVLRELGVMNNNLVTTAHSYSRIVFINQSLMETWHPFRKCSGISRRCSGISRRIRHRLRRFCSKSERTSRNSRWLCGNFWSLS